MAGPAFGGVAAATLVVLLSVAWPALLDCNRRDSAANLVDATMVGGTAGLVFGLSTRCILTAEFFGPTIGCIGSRLRCKVATAACIASANASAVVGRPRPLSCRSRGVSLEIDLVAFGFAAPALKYDGIGKRSTPICARLGLA